MKIKSPLLLFSSSKFGLKLPAVIVDEIRNRAVGVESQRAALVGIDAVVRAEKIEYAFDSLRVARGDHLRAGRAGERAAEIFADVRARRRIDDPAGDEPDRADGFRCLEFFEQFDAFDAEARPRAADVQETGRAVTVDDHVFEALIVRITNRPIDPENELAGARALVHQPRRLHFIVITGNVARMQRQRGLF